MRSWIRYIVTASPLHLILLLMLMAWVTSHLPDHYTLMIRLFNQWTIAAVLIWGFMKFGQESRQHRVELGKHREEIVAVMQSREGDLVVLRENAARLAVETARIAEDLAEKVKQAGKATEQRMQDLAVKIEAGTEHARSAYHVANSVNEKIDDQQKALVQLNEQLLSERQTHEKDGEILTTIKDVSVESNEILKSTLVDGKH